MKFTQRLFWDKNKHFAHVIILLIKAKMNNAFYLKYEYMLFYSLYMLWSLEKMLDIGGNCNFRTFFMIFIYLFLMIK